MKSSIKLAILALVGALNCAAVVPYFGGSVGYLIDSEDALFSVAAGAEFSRNGNLTHNVEAEVLYSRSNEGVEFEILPFMANYRLGFGGGEKLTTSVGAGVGMTRASLDFWGRRESDTAFTYQAFMAIGYKLSEKLKIETAVRYLNIGEAHLAGIKAKVGDDTAVSLGLSYSF